MGVVRQYIQVLVHKSAKSILFSVIYLKYAINVAVKLVCCEDSKNTRSQLFLVSRFS